MVDVTITGKAAERLREIAQRENRPVEAVVEELLAQHTRMDSVPPDIEDRAAYLAALKEIRPKIYEIAREYWRKVGDQERLALTNEQLDEVFWLIDHEGIPRFKSEMGSVHLPPDPLEAIVGIIDTDRTDLSTMTRDTIAAQQKKNDRTD
jgi:hypothetical protein